ncbi:MAG: hypothetical protein EBY26_06245 [Microbacteriaceae bacterium]|nr:hypothetical protein [Microbacteriaceae bacterium]
MSEIHNQQETAVEQMRRVREQLNREIEAVSGPDLLDRVHGHRYTSPLLQRLALKAVGKSKASGVVSGHP